MKFHVDGELEFVNVNDVHWVARHVGELVQVNLSKNLPLLTWIKKTRHEVWHLVQLRDDRELTTWLEAAQKVYTELNCGTTFYFLSPIEIEARLVEELGYCPVQLRNVLSLQSLQFYHDRGLLIVALQQAVLHELESRNLHELEGFLEIRSVRPIVFPPIS